MVDESPDELAERVASILGTSRVDRVERLSGGASRETWRVVAGALQWILQRQRPGSPRDLAVEVAALHAAYAAGVPVPRVVASGDAEQLGEPFMVLEYIEGETIARKILRDEMFVSARQVLVRHMAQALAAIHRVSVNEVPALPDTDQLAHYRQALDDLGEAHPTFELAFRWLYDHRPPTRRHTLVHGDFRLGNLMVGADGLRAVLDWELTHAGDPLEDLGWLCVRAWRFGGGRPVAGLGDYEHLLEAYGQASGVTVTMEELRWWEVLGTLKWGIMCISQAATHRLGLSRSHELAAIGRRVCENEHDVFRALEGHW
jgi:aminoglycoside phosphotransferase (APT) family kinase protein